MKYFTALISVVFSFHLATTSDTCTDTTTSAPTTSFFERDWFAEISVRDVVSSRINENEKIDKKIIDTVAQHASNCNTYSKLDLPTERFTFPKSSITVDLGSANVTFYGIRISRLSPTERKSYSTSIKCYSTSTRMAEIEVKLPLEISANLKVTGKITNSSKEFQTLSDILDEGSLSIILKNSTILKQFPIHTNDSDNTTWKIFYSKTLVSLDIAKQFQIPIHNKLQTIFDEVESFLTEKFNVEFAKTFISVANDCTKFINTDKIVIQDYVSGFQNMIDDLYRIPNRDLNMLRECYPHEGPVYTDHHACYKSEGPFIINGLSSFNSTKFSVSENEGASPDGAEIKEITVEIKTNHLKGKVDYLHHSEPLTISFKLESIKFEVKKRITGSYVRSNNNKVDVQVSVHSGDIQIEMITANLSLKNDSHLKDTLGDMLKGIIKYQLRELFQKKIRNESLFMNCP